MKNSEFYNLLGVLEEHKDKIGDLKLEDILGLSDLAISRLKTVPFDKLNSVSVPFVINKTILESYYFEEYVRIFSGVTYSETADYLYNLATNVNSLQSEYHLIDMETIANADGLKIAKCLFQLATDVNSLQSVHHLKDMETLSRTVDPDIAYVLKLLATDVNSLQSVHHLKDMETISRAEDLDIAKYLVRVATNANSLQRSVYHLEDMKTIAEVGDCSIARKLHYIAIDVNSLQSIQHLTDMEKCIMDYYEEEIGFTLSDAIACISDYGILFNDDEEATLYNVFKAMRKTRAKQKNGRY